MAVPFVRKMGLVVFRFLFVNALIFWNEQVLAYGRNIIMTEQCFSFGDQQHKVIGDILFYFR